eukprot:TRINITY_DN3335_c0_g1_i1.p2 TRINITY_DN3335_c0_g1~~TRINITY_DN3335_c0_g1_i1.p2  ORF type:complete len:192 (+),score=31.14 TRINITY_DN3335_c0_g1_i1:74-577(+)
MCNKIILAILCTMCALGCSEGSTCHRMVELVDTIEIKTRERTLHVPLAWEDEEETQISYKGTICTIKQTEEGCKVAFGEEWEADIELQSLDDITVGKGMFKTQTEECVLRLSAIKGVASGIVMCAGESTFTFSTADKTSLSSFDELRRYLPVSLMVLFLIGRYIWMA